VVVGCMRVGLPLRAVLQTSPVPALLLPGHRQHTYSKSYQLLPCLQSSQTPTSQHMHASRVIQQPSQNRRNFCCCPC